MEVIVEGQCSTSRFMRAFCKICVRFRLSIALLPRVCFSAGSITLSLLMYATSGLKNKRKPECQLLNTCALSTSGINEQGKKLQKIKKFLPRSDMKM